MKISFQKNRIYSLAVFMSVFLGTSTLSIGQTWSEVIKLTASDAGLGDEFGYSISISGEIAIVGAPFDASNTGSAYIFELIGDTWVEIQKLTASDASTNDQFGNSVSISGNRLIIGAPYNDDDDGSYSGSAYIFELEGATWLETEKLIASDGAPSDNLGISVSISDDKVIVGAYFSDDDGVTSGSAYIFGLLGDTWVEMDKLTASDASSGDLFGNSVSISADYAIVGAHFNDDEGLNSGSAYIFELEGDTWVEIEKLTASDAASGDEFGKSVSISGDRAIIGAHRDGSGSARGAAYIFELSGVIWVEMQKLTASDASTGDRFGFSVSISSNKAIVGAYLNDDDGYSSGSAYVFELAEGTWVEIDKLTASDAIDADRFGYSVSISDDIAAIGAYLNDDDGSSSGSVYIFGRCLLPPIVTISADEVEVCDGELVTLNGGGAMSYEWDGDVTDDTPFTPPIGTTTYTVIGTDDAGCENTASIDIVVNELPTVTASADDTEVCDGDLIILSGDGATTHIWDGDVTDDTPFTPPIGTTTYTVIGTDEAGCENTASIDIVVNELPTVTASADDTEVCDGDLIILSGDGATTHIWDGGVTDETPFAPPIGTTTYTVIGTDDAGCENTASIDITVYDAITMTAITTDELFGEDATIDITVTGGNPIYSFDWNNDGTGDFDDDEDLNDIIQGTYLIVVQDESGCTGTETIVVNTQLGIDKLNLNNISIFPNPTSDKVTIELDGEFIYRLISLNGKVLSVTKAVNQSSINLTEFAGGIYFLEIQSKNGSEIVKVIKQL